ncbi:unnamed protein product [Natator depressus]
MPTAPSAFPACRARYIGLHSLLTELSLLSLLHHLSDQLPGQTTNICLYEWLSCHIVFSLFYPENSDSIFLVPKQTRPPSPWLYVLEQLRLLAKFTPGRHLCALGLHSSSSVSPSFLAPLCMVDRDHPLPWLCSDQACLRRTVMDRRSLGLTRDCSRRPGVSCFTCWTSDTPSSQLTPLASLWYIDSLPQAEWKPKGEGLFPWARAK